MSGIPHMLGCTCENCQWRNMLREFRPNQYTTPNPRYQRTITDWHEQEMTAADLGLPLGQWSSEWLRSAYGRAPIPLSVWLERQPDAPYAFWLGSEGLQPHRRDEVDPWESPWIGEETVARVREAARIWDMGA